MYHTAFVLLADVPLHYGNFIS